MRLKLFLRSLCVNSVCSRSTGVVGPSTMFHGGVPADVSGGRWCIFSIALGIPLGCVCPIAKSLAIMFLRSCSGVSRSCKFSSQSSFLRLLSFPIPSRILHTYNNCLSLCISPYAATTMRSRLRKQIRTRGDMWRGEFLGGLLWRGHSVGEELQWFMVSRFCVSMRKDGVASKSRAQR